MFGWLPAERFECEKLLFKNTTKYAKDKVGDNYLDHSRMISSTVSRPRCPILHRPSIFWNLLCLSNQSIYADLKLLVLPLHTLASHPYDQPSVLRNQLCLRCETGTVFAISTCIQSNPSSQANLW
jgi:hypothetical protein